MTEIPSCFQCASQCDENEKMYLLTTKIEVVKKWRKRKFLLFFFLFLSLSLSFRCDLAELDRRPPPPPSFVGCCSSFHATDVERISISFGSNTERRPTWNLSLSIYLFHALCTHTHIYIYSVLHVYIQKRRRRRRRLQGFQSHFSRNFQCHHTHRRLTNRAAEQSRVEKAIFETFRTLCDWCPSGRVSWFSRRRSLGRAQPRSSQLSIVRLWHEAV